MWHLHCHTSALARLAMATPQGTLVCALQADHTRIHMLNMHAWGPKRGCILGQLKGHHYHWHSTLGSCYLHVPHLSLGLDCAKLAYEL